MEKNNYSLVGKYIEMTNRILLQRTCVIGVHPKRDWRVELQLTSEKDNSRTRALNHLECSKSLLDDSITLQMLFLIADVLGYP
jgi:hypothetical protein